MEENQFLLQIQRIIPFLKDRTKRNLLFISKKTKEAVIQSGCLEAITGTNTDLQDIKQFLSRESKLKTVNIQFADLQDDDLKNTVSTCITHLNLNGCQKITSKGLEALSTKKLNLSRLELYWLINLTDRGFCKLIQGCSNLTYLNLAGCKYLKDPSLSYTIKSCPSLVHLVPL